MWRTRLRMRCHGTPRRRLLRLVPGSASQGVGREVTTPSHPHAWPRANARNVLSTRNTGAIQIYRQLKIWGPHLTVQTIKKPTTERNFRQNQCVLLGKKVVQYHKAMQFRHAHTCSSLLECQKINAVLLYWTKKFGIKCDTVYRTHIIHISLTKCQFA